MIVLTFLIESAWAHSMGDMPISWGTWSFSSTVVTGLFLLCLFYILGRRKRRELHKKEAALFFWSSIFFLVAALLSPIDPMSDKLGWVHMLQHTLLMMVAAPLLVLALADVYGPLGLPGVMRKRSLSRFVFKLQQFRRPFSILSLYALTLWLWHLPMFYELALKNELVHDFQHLAFFITSFLFWRVVLVPKGRSAINPALGMIYLFVTSFHAMLLGVLMALAPEPWYAPYVTTAPAYGLSALEDQQLAGYIMWMPAGISYVLAALLLIFRLFKPAKAT